MRFSREILEPPFRNTERTIFTLEEYRRAWSIHFTKLYLITMLDKLNRAKYLYDEATSEEERQKADKTFADYYDWFVWQQIPITYDQTIRRWLLVERYEE